jgi:serine/threonine protein kinase/tetratricopeptide (TPR) repeat protein
VPCGAIEHFIRAFETARTNGDRSEIQQFLPPREHPYYDQVVRELVRIDLEFGWESGNPRPLDDYIRKFSSTFSRPSVVREVAYEEYRQRCEHGERPSPEEYATRWGIEGSEHCPWTMAADGSPWDVKTESAVAPFAARDAAELYQALRQSNPDAAERLTTAVAQMPCAGRSFLGFYLVEELGRGAFGRVFLAQDSALAGRLVALKVSPRFESEPQTLARLQHTNIVPIYSVHHDGPFQAVCMPYWGPTTLVDVLRDLRECGGLPASGRHFISTINNRMSRTRDGEETPEKPHPIYCDSMPKRMIQAVPHLERFAKLSYVEAVLWMIARLADGLAHAHERGIVHRDLKPANVLLSDEGQPMLLDFNLSDDGSPAQHAAGAKIGGTLPYMSPEQLDQFVGKPSRVDGRSDLFSLGLMACELLTGWHPFPMPAGRIDEVMKDVVSQRRIEPPRLRRMNPAISPAAEAIVRRCLEPDPERRYPSAAALREDLERHLRNEPLKHTAEPSYRERLKKWSRRHPRLSSGSTVGIVAVAAGLIASAVALGYWNEHLREKRRLVAGETLGTFERIKHEQQALIHSNLPNAALRISETSREALSGLGLLENPQWLDQVGGPLNPADRERLKRNSSEVLLGWADAETRLAGGDRTSERLGLAWQLNERAVQCLGADQVSRTLLRQRAELAKKLNQPAYAELEAKAAAMTPTSTADYCAVAREHLRRHEVRRAVPPLIEATRLDPRNFWAWYSLGNCCYELHQSDEAIAAYSACIGLAPLESVAYFPYFHRGLVYLALGRIRDADSDFDNAAKRLSALPADLLAVERAKCLLQKAKVRVAQKDLDGAEHLLSEALEFGAMETQLYQERAAVRKQSGDLARAERDLHLAVRVEPSDATGWNDRGLARLDADPKGALADFEKALSLEPDFHAALQNKAHVLSEHLGRPDEGLAAVNRLVELYPGFVQARIGRGVLLARQGRRQEAHADVRESLARDRSAPTLYQAANVFALTSKVVTSDAERVIPLLSAALWNGFGLDVIDEDGDMNPVRDRADFQRLVEVVRELQKEIGGGRQP